MIARHVDIVQAKTCVLCTACRHLEASGLWQVPAPQVSAILRSCLQLQHLGLAGCSLLGDESLACLWELSAPASRGSAQQASAQQEQQCQGTAAVHAGSLPGVALTSLDVSGTRISGTALCALALRLPLLSHLFVSGCIGLSYQQLLRWVVLRHAAVQWSAGGAPPAQPGAAGVAAAVQCPAPMPLQTLVAAGLSTGQGQGLGQGLVQGGSSDGEDMAAAGQTQGWQQPWGEGSQQQPTLDVSQAPGAPAGAQASRHASRQAGRASGGIPALAHLASQVGQLWGRQVHTAQASLESILPAWALAGAGVGAAGQAAGMEEEQEEGDDDEELYLEDVLGPAGAQGLRLAHLDLSGCPLVTDAVLASLSAQHGPTLQRLMLSGCGEVTDEGLQHIAAHCSHLTQLSLSGPPQGPASAAGASARAPGSGFWRPTAGGAGGGSGAYGQARKRLRRQGVTDAGVAALAASVCRDGWSGIQASGIQRDDPAPGPYGAPPPPAAPTGLQRLSVSRVSLGDAALTAVTGLVSLDLSNCKRLSDHGVLQALVNCPSLISLSLSGCSGSLSPAGLGCSTVATAAAPGGVGAADAAAPGPAAWGSAGAAAPAASPHAGAHSASRAVLRGRALTSLALPASMASSTCLAWTGQGGLVPLGPSGHCMQLVDVDIAAGSATPQVITQLAQACPCLRRLALRGASQLTDDAACQVLRICRLLARLTITNCPGITDATLAMALQRSIPVCSSQAQSQAQPGATAGGGCLQHLVLTGCPKVQGQAFVQLTVGHAAEAVTAPSGTVCTPLQGPGDVAASRSSPAVPDQVPATGLRQEPEQEPRHWEWQPSRAAEAAGPALVNSSLSAVLDAARACVAAAEPGEGQAAYTALCGAVGAWKLQHQTVAAGPILQTLKVSHCGSLLAACCAVLCCSHLQALSFTGSRAVTGAVLALASSAGLPLRSLGLSGTGTAQLPCCGGMEKGLRLLSMLELPVQLQQHASVKAFAACCADVKLAFA